MNDRRPKVMLVEDEESVRLLLRLTLELGSVEIVEAPDGETAVERCVAERPDVVFRRGGAPGGTRCGRGRLHLEAVLPRTAA
jgi:CheY-like chemotaxis protein